MLRAAGACPLPDRTYRRAYPAASGSSRLFEGIGIAGWRYLYPLDSMTDSPISRGAAIRAIRPPQGVMEALPRSSRRRPPRRGPPHGPSQPYGKSGTTTMQHILARKETDGGLQAAQRAVPQTSFCLQCSRALRGGDDKYLKALAKLVVTAQLAGRVSNSSSGSGMMQPRGTP
jgi:hypothetical protein